MVQECQPPYRVAVGCMDLSLAQLPLSLACFFFHAPGTEVVSAATAERGCRLPGAVPSAVPSARARTRGLKQLRFQRAVTGI